MTKPEAIDWLIKLLEELDTSDWQQSEYKIQFFEVFKAQRSARLSLSGDEIYLTARERMGGQKFEAIQENASDVCKAWKEWEYCSDNLAPIGTKT